MVEKLKNSFKKYFSNGPKAIFAVFVVLVLLTILICNTRKTIIVSIDGKDKKVTTLSNTYRRALSNNGIVVGPKDKTKPSLDSKVENGTKISVKKAVNVKVEVDGKQLNVQSAEANIDKMLAAEGIKVKEFDKVNPAKGQAIKDGLKVIVTRVDTKELKEVKPVDYTTIVKNDDSMQKGDSKVIQEGQTGEKENIIKVIYENGKEISRKIVSETIKKQPTQKVVAMGTLSVYTPSRGQQFSYSRTIKMRSTAYTADYDSTGKSPGDSDFGITATGTVARRNHGSYSSVAVDPRVIPLGTKLYVEGYGFAVAEDTGGAIKGERIDLFFNSSSEVDNWGVRWINVYVIK